MERQKTQNSQHYIDEKEHQKADTIKPQDLLSYSNPSSVVLV